MWDYSRVAPGQVSEVPVAPHRRPSWTPSWMPSWTTVATTCNLQLLPTAGPSMSTGTRSQGSAGSGVTGGCG